MTYLSKKLPDNCELLGDDTMKSIIKKNAIKGGHISVKVLFQFRAYKIEAYERRKTFWLVFVIIFATSFTIA